MRHRWTLAAHAVGMHIDLLPDHTISPLHMRRSGDVIRAHILPPSNIPTKTAKGRWVQKIVWQFEHLIGHSVCLSKLAFLPSIVHVAPRLSSR